MLLETLLKKKKKRLCHPHSWNVMHAVHRVCFKWEAEKGGGGGGGELFRRARVHGGLATRGRVCPTEKDEAQNSLPLLLFLLQKHTSPLTFFSCFWWEIINDDQSRLFGLWPIRGGGGGLGGDVARAVRWSGGGWERLKGRGRKEVHFRRMGGWKKQKGTITPMF